jgi:peptide/nickel transport system ATP-binding protein
MEIMTLANNILDIKNLSITYHNGAEEVLLLKNITFGLVKGSTLGITGPSGSGKSLTGLAIAGLLEYTGLTISSGSIYSSGQDVLQRASADWVKRRGKKISIIFQNADAALNPVLRCGSQIGEAYLIHHPETSPKNLRKIVFDMLSKVGLTDCERIYKSYPFELSGGQQQRIAIAIAIINRPELIIADEITSSLDFNTANEIITLIKSIQSESGCSLILISHDMRILFNTCQAVILLKDGEIVNHIDTASDITDKLSDYAKAYFTATLSDNPPAEMRKSGLLTSLLKVVDVTKAYRTGGILNFYKKNKQFVLKNISFNLNEGAGLGIIGSSGSGKTTLSKIIAGINEVTSGLIYFKNEPISALILQSNKSLRKKIQIIFQDSYSSFDPKNTVEQILTEIIYVHKKDIKIENINEFIVKWLEKFSLTKDILAKYTRQLSGGQRQRVALARTLLMSPDIIIFDESLSALDIYNQKLVVDLIKKQQAIHKFAVIFVSHDPDLIKSTCEKTLCLHTGGHYEYGDTAELLNRLK